MRIKIQARNSAGIFEDIIINPSEKHLVAFELMPYDMEYIEAKVRSLANINSTQERMLLGGIPARVKTRITSPSGSPIDLIVERARGEWISMELTPRDVSRLLQSGPSQGVRRRVNATMPGVKITAEDMHQFNTNWPDAPAEDGYFPDRLTGVPRGMHGSEADAFMQWASYWPPVFHSSDRAPEASLILPDGLRKD